MDDQDVGGAAPSAEHRGFDLEPDTTEVVRRVGRARWAAAFLALVAAVAGLLVLVGSDGDPDADAALAAAQEVVAESEAYAFEVLRSDRIVIGDPQGAGSDTTTRTLSVGQVAGPDRWHVVDDAGDPNYPEPQYEATRLGDEVFVRWPDGSDTPEGVVVPTWVAAPVGEPPTVEDLAAMYGSIGEETCLTEDGSEEPCDFDPVYEAEQKVDLVVTAYLLPVSADPHHVERLVAEATDPAIEERLSDGGLRLRVRLDPIPEVLDAADESVPPVDLLLDLDADRRPTLARFTAALDRVSSAVEVRFRGWGAEQPVAAPAEADVDRTPWIDEELLTLHPDLVVAPAQVPAGFVLTHVDLWQGFDEEDDCPQLELRYGTEEEQAFFSDDEALDDAAVRAFFEQLDYLSVSVAPTACHAASSGGVALGLGPVDREIEPREVQVGEVTVTISTTLDPAVVDSLASSLRRFTVAELAATIPASVLEAEWFDGPAIPYGW